MENLPNIAEDNNMDAERADTLDSQPDEVSDQEPDLVLVGTFRVPRLPQPDPEQTPAVWPADQRSNPQPDPEQAPAVWPAEVPVTPQRSNPQPDSEQAPLVWPGEVPVTPWAHHEDQHSNPDPWDKSHLPSDRRIIGRAPWHSPIGQADRGILARSAYFDFFRAPQPWQKLRFLYAPMWHIASTDRPLDDLVLFANHLVSFNGNPAHGRWETPIHPMGGPGALSYLDINGNVRFGLPAFPSEPAVGKWFRFQRLPGTNNFLHIGSNNDHAWSVMLIPLGVQAWQIS